MKKLVFLGILICGGIFSAYSQFNENPILNLENEDKKLVNWGYYLGFNQYGFKVDYIEDDGIYILDGKSTGFNVGLIGELRLNDYFDLRLEPGLFYTQRNIGFPNFSNVDDYLRETKSTYIHIPLLLKASTKRLGNFKPYIVGGLSTSLNLSSEQDNKSDNSRGQFRMKKNTYYYELGFGIDFYLHYFKFSPSIRGVFAMSDELVRDADPNSPWTGNIDGLYTRAVFINFTFE
ncbi:porin family protein [Robertkochia solimangrovi]|uniref:type IX secretion/gliding motility protein PorT/SprT n=1 Tax=Robertkochia solimangrovi TaxID=2213046 RepID=UPI00117F028E|nr:porin family protein [Robertkochia solimangrovi]TRZ41385.1 PorT family protein [Robertkochia solimangrovi]